MAYLNGTLLAKSTENIAKTIEMSSQTELSTTDMSRIEGPPLLLHIVGLNVTVSCSKFRR